MFDVIIVGSGPAGLSASLYTRRANFSTLVIEGEMPGGLLSTTEQIDNYIGLPGVEGLEMSKMFKEHSESFGTEFSSGTVELITKDENNVFTVFLTNGDTFQSKTVIYSAGSTPRKLGVTGEEINGVSYCATCDGMFFQDSPVIVIGGGEAAAEEALYMSQIASSVKIIVRGHTLKASQSTLDKISEKENIEIIFGSQVELFTGTTLLTSATLNTGIVLDIDGAFIAIGQVPNSQVAETHTKLLSNGFIHKSVVDGFFVAGDVGSQEYRQIIIAAGSGAKAAIDATKYLLS